MEIHFDGYREIVTDGIELTNNVLEIFIWNAVRMRIFCSMNASPRSSFLILLTGRCRMMLRG